MRVSLTMEKFDSESVKDAPPPVLIFDPHRKLGESVEYKFIDQIALAFHQVGSKVTWYVSRNNRMTDRPYAAISRSLEEPNTQLELLPKDNGGRRSNDADARIHSRPDGGKSTSSKALGEKGAIKITIIKLDEWAQAEIKLKRSKPLRFIAKRCYRLIRLYYRIEYSTNFGLYQIGLKWRKAKKKYWTFAYTVQQSRRKLALLIRLQALDPLTRKLNRFLSPLSRYVHSVAAKIGSRTAPRAQGSAQWLSLFSGCSEGTIIFLPTASIDDVYELFEIVPALQLDRPLAYSAHIFLFGSECDSVPLDRLEFLASQLRSGSPFQSVTFYAWSESLQSAAVRIGLHVHSLKPYLASSEHDLRTLFYSPDTGKKCPAACLKPSITTDELGPIALQVTALWGKVGSSAVFDAQLKYLISRGFFVVRIFVDHYPQRGDQQVTRAEQLASESFGRYCRPHIHFTMARNESVPPRDQQFQSATPVLRGAVILANATAMDEQEGFRWFGERASIAIVNHLPHVLLAGRITSAPLILETHDVYSYLLDIHGIPHFVPSGPDGAEKRLAEEQKLWGSVAACVNLSPEDHQRIKPYAKRSILIKPYVERPKAERRSWLQVFMANGLEEKYRNNNEFDVLLWGSWHQGNVDSITWFINEVMPLDHRLNDISIVIVGRVAAGLSSKILQHPQISVVGFVDSLDDFIARSKVLVIPDRDGTGISIKAIDTFARGACFAGTKAGLRGIDLAGVDYSPSATAKALATDVAELLASPKHRLQRSAVAASLYERNFSRRAYDSSWDSLLKKIIPTTLPLEIQADTLSFSSLRTETVSNAKKASSSAKLKRSGPMLKAKSKPALTVVVCTYNRYDVLPDAINSLLNQDVVSGALETIVVDNSPDQTAASAFGRRYKQAPLQYILEPVPGLSNARNVGAERAKAAIVAYIDDDSIAHRDWAKSILEAFDKDGLDHTGVVGGRVTPRWVTPPPKWLTPKHFGYLSILDWGDELRPIRSNEWLVGCNIAYNRAALIEAGGFSRALGRVGAGAALLSNEDTEMTEKVERSGLLSYYAPHAVVEHVIDPNRLTQNWFRRRAAWQAVSDFVKDPKTAQQRLTGAEKNLLWAAQPGTRKLPIGMFSPNADIQEFSDDMSLIYNLVVTTLNGGSEVKTGDN